MKKQVILMTVVTAMNITASINAAFAKTILDVNPRESSIFWTGKKGVEVLGKHTGKVGIKSGKVEFSDKGEISKANIEIDMNGITNDDLTGDMKDKLLGHLKSKDFFDVQNFKSAYFNTIKVAKIEKNKYKLIGNMTIKGKTNPAEIIGEYSQKGNEHIFNGNLIFDRTKYDIKFGSGDFFTGLGDKMIHNDVELSFSIKA